MNNIPDWLKGNYQQLSSLMAQDRLPHGLLVIGHEGNGSTNFTSALISTLLCTTSTQQACGQCKSCLLHSKASHPDYLIVEPEGKSLTIKVDAIRAVISKLAETAQQGGKKVVYIKNAEKMNVNAANALLKVLEEPTKDTFIVLETPELGRLLPTIRSRCRLVTLERPSFNQSLALVKNTKKLNGVEILALGMAQGRPFDAMNISQQDIDVWNENEQQFFTARSLIELSRYIGGRSLEAILDQVLMWVDTTIKKKQRIENIGTPVSEKAVSSLENIDNASLFRFRDYILSNLSAINRQANLNSQLVCEELASNWLSLRGLK